MYDYVWTYDDVCIYIYIYGDSYIWLYVYFYMWILNIYIYIVIYLLLILLSFCIAGQRNSNDANQILKNVLQKNDHICTLSSTVTIYDHNLAMCKLAMCK